MDWQQIVGVLFGALIIYLALAIRWVPRPYLWIIEINLPLIGMHFYEWKPGIHFLWVPIKPLMYVRNKINMAQKSATLHMGVKDGIGRPDPVDFKDAKAGVLAQVIFQVTNPEHATYNVQEEDLTVTSHDDGGNEIQESYRGYERVSLNQVEAALRNFFGTLEFQKANEDMKKNDIETHVLSTVKNPGNGRWGVVILSIDIIDFILDDATSQVRAQSLAVKLEKEVAITRAEGEKQAAVLKAQGQKEATITVAQGDAEAARLAGLGEQDRIKGIRDAGLVPVHAAAYILARDANANIREGKATIIATSEGGNMNVAATLAGIAKGMGLGGGNQNASPTPAPTPAPQTPQSTRRRGNNP